VTRGGARRDCRRNLRAVRNTSSVGPDRPGNGYRALWSKSSRWTGGRSLRPHTRWIVSLITICS